MNTISAPAPYVEGRTVIPVASAFPTAFFDTLIAFFVLAIFFTQAACQVRNVIPLRIAFKTACC